MNTRTVQTPTSTMELLKVQLFQRFQCEHPAVAFLNMRLICLNCGLVLSDKDRTLDRPTGRIGGYV